MSPFFLFIYLIFGGILGGLLSTIASMASLATYPVLLSVGIPQFMQILLMMQP